MFYKRLVSTILGLIASIPVPSERDVYSIGETSLLILTKLTFIKLVHDGFLISYGLDLHIYPRVS